MNGNEEASTTTPSPGSAKAVATVARPWADPLNSITPRAPRSRPWVVRSRSASTSRSPLEP